MPFLDTGKTRLFSMSQSLATASAIVFSYSLGTTHRMWDRVVDEQAAEFRCIPDHTRGHGRTDVPAAPYEIADLADDLIALLDRLDVESVHDGCPDRIPGMAIVQAFAASYLRRRCC